MLIRTVMVSLTQPNQYKQFNHNQMTYDLIFIFNWSENEMYALCRYSITKNTILNNYYIAYTHSYCVVILSFCLRYIKLITNEPIIDIDAHLGCYYNNVTH